MDHLQPIQILLYAFPGIPDTEAEELVKRGEVRSYPPGTILCHEGALEDTFYIILNGEVEVTKALDEIQARRLNQLGPGDFFGEMAIIHNAVRAASVACLTPTTVLEIHRDAFDLLMRRSASISLAMVREVSQRLRDNDELAIEDLRLKATELALAYQKLAEQDLARREFVTCIAHELRTPLTSASGLLQMLQGGALPAADLPTALATIHANVGQMVTLVNDLLFLQEMDLILPKFERVELRPLLEAAVQAVSPMAEKMHVQLYLETDRVLPPISGDRRSLERSFTALLDNAIKFSPNGGEVHLQAAAEGDSLWVQVRDQGVGIPPAALPRVFDRFFHLDQVDEYLFRGLGLGLSIARQVIEQHHGRIEIVSSLGEGTQVTVTLPRRGDEAA
jgi:signal transduction histidine kinase